jgi:peptide/nickel transport system substrate-binding protein
MLLVDYRMGIIGEGSLPNIEENPNGTGPFKLVKPDIYGTSVFAAHDDYWDGKPGLAAIEFVGIADAQARTQALLSGQTDLSFNVTLEEAELFVQEPGYEVLEVVTGNWDGIVMDVREPPFDDLRVRQALKLVVDRQEILDVVLQGYGVMAYDHPVWPGDAYQLELDPPHDVEKAKELLAEAGYPDGLDLELISSPVDPYFMPLAVVYQQQAAEAGINIEIRQVPADGYWSGEQGWMAEPFFMTSWSQRTADQILNEALSCAATWNESRWCNEEFDQAIANARSELDQAKRTEFYQEAQRLAAEDGATILPYFRTGIWAMKTKVKGLPPIFYKNTLWHEIYIEE